jgi:hypothetical protein
MLYKVRCGTMERTRNGVSAKVQGYFYATIIRLAFINLMGSFVIITLLLALVASTHA